MVHRGYRQGALTVTGYGRDFADLSLIHVSFGVLDGERWRVIAANTVKKPEYASYQAGQARSRHLHPTGAGYQHTGSFAHAVSV